MLAENYLKSYIWYVLLADEQFAEKAVLQL